MTRTVSDGEQDLLNEHVERIMYREEQEKEWWMKWDQMTNPEKIKIRESNMYGIFNGPGAQVGRVISGYVLNTEVGESRNSYINKVLKSVATVGLVPEKSLHNFRSTLNIMPEETAILSGNGIDTVAGFIAVMENEGEAIIMPYGASGATRTTVKEAI